MSRIQQGQGKKLSDYIGGNDKTKIIAKLQKKGAGRRSPPMTPPPYPCGCADGLARCTHERRGWGTRTREWIRRCARAAGGYPHDTWP